MNRSPELDLVLARYESPKLRLPPSLTSKPSVDIVHSQRENDEEEEEEEEGTWDRSFVKSASVKSLRIERAKAEKAAKEKDKLKPQD